MNRVRRFTSVLWLALALLVGQQAAALHDLGHATGQLTQKHDSTPANSTCDKCFACAGFSGVLGAAPNVVPVVAADTLHEVDCFPPGALAAARLAFRSRAPPTLL